MTHRVMSSCVIAGKFVKPTRWASAGTITTSNLYAAAWSSLVGVLYSVQKSINQASAVDALDELNKL